MRHWFALAAIIPLVPALAFMPGSQPTVPPVPFLTQFSYWDHHWIQWLPGHPIYESIEAQVFAPDPGQPERRLIRVLLTERALPKRQVAYLNDSASAAVYRGEAYFRPITVQLSGKDAEARGLDLLLNDRNGRPIEWHMAFPRSQSLDAPGRGWSGQEGHGAAATYLYRYRGDAAATLESRITLDGQPYAVEAEDPNPLGFRAGYVRQAWTPVVLLTEVPVFPAGNGGLAMGQTRPFRPGAAGTLESAPFGFQGLGKVTLDVTPSGGLRRYTHRLGTHAVSVMFEPALSWAAGSHRFAFQVDNQPDILAGTIDATYEGGILTLVWHYDAPWNQSFEPLRSELRSAGNGYALVVRRDGQH